MNEVGKALIGIVMLMVFVGVAFVVSARVGLPLGRLPGDFAWRGKNGTVYLPLGTSIFISLVLTGIFYLLSRWKK